MPSERFESEVKTITEEYTRLLIDEKDWYLEKEEDGCKISSTMTRNSTKSRCFKCEYQFEMSPERLLDTIHYFGPYKPQYDENFVSSHVIEELSDKSVIGQFVGKIQILGISFTGDYINAYVFDKTNDYHFTAYGSVKYDKDLPKGVGMRGWMHPSGFAAFRTSDPNVSKVVIIWHSEHQALPGFLVKSVIETASVAGMLRYIKSLKAMKDKPFVPLTKEVPMCRNR